MELSQSQRKLLRVRSLPFRVQHSDGTLLPELEDGTGMATEIRESDGSDLKM